MNVPLRDVHVFGIIKVMRITFKGTNLTLTPAIEAYAESKFGGLDRFFETQEEVEVRLELGRTTRHHKQGEDVYRAEVNLELPGRMIRAEASALDLHAAIDLVKDELKRELSKDRERRDTLYRKGARAMKAIFRYSPLAWPGWLVRSGLKGIRKLPIPRLPRRFRGR